MPKFVAALRNPKEPVNLRGHLSQEEEEVEVQVEVGEEGELQVEGAITKFWDFEAYLHLVANDPIPKGSLSAETLVSF